MPTPRKPAIRPMRSVSGVPAIMTAKRSRPCRSEPNQSVDEGGWSGRTEIGRALSASAQALRSGALAASLPRAATAILGPPVGDARIEERIAEVEDQERDAEREDHAENDTLDEEEVGGPDRLEERVADAREGEDHL